MEDRQDYARQRSDLGLSRRQTAARSMSTATFVNCWTTTTQSAVGDCRLPRSKNLRSAPVGMANCLMTEKRCSASRLRRRGRSLRPHEERDRDDDSMPGSSQSKRPRGASSSITTRTAYGRTPHCEDHPGGRSRRRDRLDRRAPQERVNDERIDPFLASTIARAADRTMINMPRFAPTNDQAGCRRRWQSSCGLSQRRSNGRGNEASLV